MTKWRSDGEMGGWVKGSAFKSDIPSQSPGERTESWRCHVETMSEWRKDKVKMTLPHIESYLLASWRRRKLVLMGGELWFPSKSPQTDFGKKKDRFHDQWRWWWWWWWTTLRRMNSFGYSIVAFGLFEITMIFYNNKSKSGKVWLEGGWSLCREAGIDVSSDLTYLFREVESTLSCLSGRALFSSLRSASHYRDEMEDKVDIILLSTSTQSHGGRDGRMDRKIECFDHETIECENRIFNVLFLKRVSK